MVTPGLAANLGSLVVGGIVISAAFRLAWRFRLPVLRHYLGYVTLTVVSGFFDWIMLNMVRLITPRVPEVESNAVYHIFWDLIGFPGAMAAACFLLWTLMGLLKMQLDRRRKAWIAAPFVVLSFLSFCYATLLTGNLRESLGLLLWNVFLYGLAAFQILILSAALVKVIRLKGGAGAPLRIFILSLLGGYLVWHVVSIVAWAWHLSLQLTIIWFFLMLIPPTLALAAHFRAAECGEVLDSPGTENLAPIALKYGLTEREADVLVLLMSGKSYQVIKGEMFLSLQTVKNHVSRIYGKTGVRNRIELANLIRNAGRR
jgi:DNA-binding CsgD family transcriptional regulator